MFNVKIVSALGPHRYANSYNFDNETAAHSFALWSFFKLRNVVAAEISPCFD